MSQTRPNFLWLFPVKNVEIGLGEKNTWLRASLASPSSIKLFSTPQTCQLPLHVPHPAPHSPPPLIRICQLCVWISLVPTDLNLHWHAIICINKGYLWSPHKGTQEGGARVLPREINKPELGQRGATHQSWRARRGGCHELIQWGSFLKGLQDRLVSAHPMRQGSDHSPKTIQWNILKRVQKEQSREKRATIRDWIVPPTPKFLCWSYNPLWLYLEIGPLKK